MILRMSGRRFDDERGARRVQRFGTDPRKSEVVRTPRFDAEDAEFGQAHAKRIGHSSAFNLANFDETTWMSAFERAIDVSSPAKKTVL